MDVVYQNGIVHGDVQPGNFMSMGEHRLYVSSILLARNYIVHDKTGTALENCRS